MVTKAQAILDYEFAIQRELIECDHSQAELLQSTLQHLQQTKPIVQLWLFAPAQQEWLSLLARLRLSQWLCSDQQLQRLLLLLPEPKPLPCSLEAEQQSAPSKTQLANVAQQQFHQYYYQLGLIQAKSNQAAPYWQAVSYQYPAQLACCDLLLHLLRSEQSYHWLS